MFPAFRRHLTDWFRWCKSRFQPGTCTEAKCLGFGDIEFGRIDLGRLQFPQGSCKIGLERVKYGLGFRTGLAREQVVVGLGPAFYFVGGHGLLEG